MYSYPTETWRWQRGQWLRCRTGTTLGPVSTPYSAASSHTLHHTVDTWWCSGCHHMSPGWKKQQQIECYKHIYGDNIMYFWYTRLKSFFVCLPWHIGIYSEYAVQEDNDAQYRGRDEELSVNTQPGKIQPNLLSKVLPVKTNKGNVWTICLGLQVYRFTFLTQ